MRRIMSSFFGHQSQMACYLASVAPHSDDWLLALPIANCGLRLEDEAVRVAVGMRLGLTLCVLHKCHCGSDIDATADMPTWSARKHLVGLQDIKCSTTILRAINAADVPAVKEPSGLNRQDGKRPDRLSLIPWQSGKPLLWDVTVASTLAGSCMDTTATAAGLVASWSGSRQKDSQIRRSQSTVCFQPVSVENLGPFSSSTLDLLRDLGRRISHISGDDREVLFLFQRISVTIQRFNSVLLHDSFTIDRPGHYSHSAGFYLLFLTLEIFTTKGI